ncbi:Tetratricopeptide repeat protein 37 [Boothiomyces sp. JEL0866]|nr:Tetratricopeptide repeat protein 37 [Boothiomyces sp. JEL0866]
MSFIKQQLKIAREAIAQKNFEYAQGLCETILENDPSNYNAAVFLGLACKELSLVNESRKAYETAIKISPLQTLAYQGLLKLFESEKDQQGIYQLSGVLGKIYLSNGDAQKYLECLNRQLDIAKSLELVNETLTILQEFLPGSESYDKIKDLDIPNPLLALSECAEICEKKYYDTIEKEIKVRRMRLGADPLPVIQFKVESEYILDAPLDSIYESIFELDLTNQQLSRFCSKYLKFMIRKVLHVGDREKVQVFRKLLEKANDCLSKSFSPIALQLVIENRDELLDERDDSNFTNYPEDDVYYSLISAYNCWKEKDFIEGIEKVLEALEKYESSIFGHQLLSEMYFAQGEWQLAIDSCEKLKKILSDQTLKYGVSLNKISTSTELILGNSFSNLGEAFSTQALTVFKAILQQDASNIAALSGLGKALLGICKLPEAKKCFEKVIKLEPSNEVAILEIGWVEYLLGNSLESVKILKNLIHSSESSLAHFRLAKVYWEMGGEFKSDKQFAHAHLIQAIKLDSTNSAPFTFLGQYYLELDSDIVRASKCFSKAISTNPKDEDAVSKLVEIWLGQDKLKESADLLLQYVGLAPRTTWGWKKLGIISMSSNMYANAINYLQTALRIIPKDVICWVLLGEAYAFEGKYVAALKALDRAIELDDSIYTSYYFKGFVNQKLGNFVDAKSNYYTVIEKLKERGLNNTLHAISTFKGMCENLIFYAKEQFENGAYGSCLLLLLESIGICSSVFSLPDAPIQCFAKLFADSCIQIYRLVPELFLKDHLNTIISACQLLVNLYGEKLQQFELEPYTCSESLDQLLYGASVGYQVAIVTCEASKNTQLANYCHDLGLSLYYRSKTSTEYSEGILESSIKFLKISLRYSPDSISSWNTLGIVTHKINPKISQHSFIRALELDSQLGFLWCNLGYFYYLNGDIDLAGQCFAKCQSVDPEYSLGWLGQALIAETLGSEEFDLFEHSFELGKVTNFEVMYNYARQCYIKPGQFQSAIINGAFALLKCVEKRYQDPTMLNLYGLLLEKLGQTEQAVEAFRSAINLMDENDSSRYLCMENLARNLCASSNFEESVQIFKSVVAAPHRDAYSFVGYGISLFFNENYAESMSAFQSALDLCDGNSDTSLFIDISLYLTQVLFAIGSDDHIALAKQQLLQCFSHNPTAARPILNLCCLSVLLSDWNLAQSSAAELIKIEPQYLESLDFDVDFVLSRMFVLQNDFETAKRFLAKAVHRYPWKAKRWARLSEFIYTHLSPLSQTAIILSESALEISKAIQPSIHAELNSTINISEIHRISGVALMAAGDQTIKSSRILSKAIMMNPSNAKNWVALALEKDSSSESELSQRCANSAIALQHDSDISKWASLVISNGQLTSNPDSVQECITVCDNIASSAQGALQQTAYGILGTALFRMNDLASSIQALKQSVVLALNSSSWIYSLHMLGSIYLQNSFASAAIECFKKAHEVSSNPASLTLLAGALLQANEIQQAHEIIMQASKQVPNSIGMKFIQTLANFKYNAKQNKSRITKNKELLNSCIDTKYYSWLESQLV